MVFMNFRKSLTKMAMERRAAAVTWNLNCIENPREKMAKMHFCDGFGEHEKLRG